jgi:hypothetical protein
MRPFSERFWLHLKIARYFGCFRGVYLIRKMDVASSIRSEKIVVQLYQSIPLGSAKSRVKKPCKILAENDGLCEADEALSAVLWRSLRQHIELALTKAAGHVACCAHQTSTLKSTRNGEVCSRGLHFFYTAQKPCNVLHAEYSYVTRQ